LIDVNLKNVFTWRGKVQNFQLEAMLNTARRGLETHALRRQPIINQTGNQQGWLQGTIRKVANSNVTSFVDLRRNFICLSTFSALITSYLRGASNHIFLCPGYNLSRRADEKNFAQSWRAPIFICF